MSKQASQSFDSRWRTVMALAAGSLSLFLASADNVSAQKSQGDLSAPQCVVDRLAQNELLAPSAMNVSSPPAAEDGSDDGPGCPQQTVTYSSHNFQSGGFFAQGGMVNTEIAAVTYTLDPINFPIRIDRIDTLVGTTSLAQQITMHWSVLVWEGQPNTGSPVYVITSDGKNPPHIVAAPPTNAVLVQAMVDPGDPDQIIVTNNGSNKFSVGFRIDQHNQSATASCFCVPSLPSFGSYPAICCPPPENLNMFPTVDLDSLSQPQNNWIWARSCPGATGFCDPNGGWFTNSAAGIQHDWNIRAVFTPTGCVTPQGACCLPTGQCLGDLTSGQCSAQGGTYQGNSTNCTSVNCPVPTGTCCLANGNCIVTTTANCASQGGTFVAVNQICTTNTCRGACCVPATQQCVFTTEANCTAANGVFQGIGTVCTGACFGACCLPSGSCVQAISARDCTSQGGTWQGGGVSCANANCPQPLGACCLGSSCLADLSQSDCVTGFGGQWLGANSTCDFNPCDPLGACCLGTSCLNDLTESDCTIGFGGVWQGAQSACSPNPCSQTCIGDIAPAGGNGVVNVQDMLAVINAWGPCPQPCPPSCAGDVTRNCLVNVQDLLSVINAWGPCP